MFTRAAKSFMQSFNQRSYHVSKTHFKHLPGNIENINYNKPSQILQHSEKAEPCVKDATLPFKNLKFQNLMNHGQGQNTLTSVEGSPTGGKFSEVDISQAVERRAARDALKNTSVAGVLVPIGDAVFKLLARMPCEQYFQVALTAARTPLRLTPHCQLSANINKAKVEELKARIKDVLERIRKKLEELQQQRGKEATAGKKEAPKPAAKKEPAKPEDKSGEKNEKAPKPVEKESQSKKKEPKDAITMLGTSAPEISTNAVFTERSSAFLFADRQLEYYSIIRGLRPVFSSISPGSQSKVEMAETGSGDHGDHARNDDYFPQGEEYEEEIGSEGFIRPVYNDQQPEQRSNRLPRGQEED